MVQPKKKIVIPSIRWVLLMLIPAGWCVLNELGSLTFFENRTIDWRFKKRGEITAPVKVVYVDVDSRSTSDIGNWQWSRHFFASVTEALINQAHVRAIGFDFVLTPKAPAQIADRDAMRKGDVELGRFVFKLPPAVPPPVVFAASFAADEFRAAEGKIAFRGLPLVATDLRKISDVEPPEQTALETPSGTALSPPYLGLIDTLQGGTRTVAAWAPTSTREYRHMAVELARLYWRLPPDSVKRMDDRIDFVRPGGGLASIPLRDRQLVDINWFSAWDSPLNPRESFVVVYAYAQNLKSENAEERKTAEEYFAQDAWKDAVVLVGPVDPLLQDLATTPLDDMPVPKVGVHGNLLKTIVSGLYLSQPPKLLSWLLVFGLTIAVTMLAVSGGARSIRYKFFALILVGAFVGFVFVLFRDYHWVLPMSAPLGAAFTASFAAVGWQLIDEEKQKGRIKGMFGTYLSRDLVNRMVDSGEDPQLGGHDAEITAYFSDIQSFSAFSEVLPSGPLVELMNEYLTACTDIVQAQGGTLDKYIGDAVVAMYGAPIPLADHAFRACVATQLVQQKLGELREKWKGEGDKWPEIVWRMQSRIGLNTGVCTIGNMGSRTRFSYTMMGDDVNLAARMESGAKQWGVYTMCTEITKQACEKHGADRVVFRPLGRIVVKGRTRAVPIYEIVGLKEAVTAQTHEGIAIFSQAMEKYYARDWDGALKLFGESRDLEFNVPGKTPGVSKNPSLVYFHRTEEFKNQPPASDWDGVIHMEEK